MQVSNESDRATFGLILIAVNCLVWAVGIGNIIPPNLLRAQGLVRTWGKKKPQHAAIKPIDSTERPNDSVAAADAQKQGVTPSESLTPPKSNALEPTQIVRMSSKEQIAPEKQ